ncbi:MAG: hypothetical protein WCN92_03830 [Eubacteriales bacterium]
MLENKYGKTIWFPRVLALAFALVLTAFYFFRFEGFAADFSGFLRGLLPAIVTLGIIAGTWKLPKYCGYYFIIFAAAFACYLLFTKSNDGLAYAMMAGVPVLIGGQFILLGTKRPGKAKDAAKAEAKPVVSEESKEIK